MAFLNIDYSKCTLCEKCIDVCPFDAMSLSEGKIEISSACKMCKLCIKQCPEDAISINEGKVCVDKRKWNGYLVYAQFDEGRIHPVTIELIGTAKRLAETTPMPIYVILIGHDTKEAAHGLLKYGVDEVFVYDDERLAEFKVDAYTNVFEDLINDIMPSVVLVGGTSIGRSLAPRAATRFRTGLTADCTSLEIKPNTDLVQIRPAFGGNIMAQIITPNTRPQFATVRYKVMDSAKQTAPHGKVTFRKVTEELTSSRIKVLRIEKKPEEVSITEADVLVVAGQGITEKEDLALVKELAHLLGGEYACTRPMVEKGWCDYTRQIGLSGRTVKPKLIITCGVSGAIQFTACMDSSERIVAINSDKNAPIFKTAHVGIIGDIYEILPGLIDKIKGAKEYAV